MGFDWQRATDRRRGQESVRAAFIPGDADTLAAIRVARGWKVRGRVWKAGDRLWWTVRDAAGIELANGPTWQVAMRRALEAHPLPPS